MPRKSSRKKAGAAVEEVGAPIGNGGGVADDGVANLMGTAPVHDPLAPQIDDEAALDAGEEAAAAAMELQAAAEAEAAEAAIGNVLDDVGVDVMHGNNDEDNEMAQAAAFAAAAADGMAVVVDQALLATAAAAAASQVADVLAEAEQQPADEDVPPPVGLPPPLPDTGLNDAGPGNYSASGTFLPSSHHDEYDGEEPMDLLQARRDKDRKRYSDMTLSQREQYNSHRRELYHKQGDESRKRRRERERDRYHALEGSEKKTRNERRASLERARYQKLTKEQLDARNAKRRERAKQRKLEAAQKAAEEAQTTTAHPVMPTIPPPGENIKTEDGEVPPSLPVASAIDSSAEPTETVHI